MTAEQFYQAWMDENWGCRSDVPKLKDWFNICEAYAAAQLAELRKESAIAKKYEQKLLHELGRVMTALRCTDEFDGPDEAVRTANELVQALEEADKLRAELGFADTTPLNVWLAHLRAQLAEKERELQEMAEELQSLRRKFREHHTLNEAETARCDVLIDSLAERLQEPK